MRMASQTYMLPGTLQHSLVCTEERFAFMYVAYDGSIGFYLNSVRIYAPPFRKQKYNIIQKAINPLIIYFSVADMLSEFS